MNVGKFYEKGVTVRKIDGVSWLHWKASVCCCVGVLYNCIGFPLKAVVSKQFGAAFCFPHHAVLIHWSLLNPLISHQKWLEIPQRNSSSRFLVLPVSLLLSYKGQQWRRRYKDQVLYIHVKLELSKPQLLVPMLRSMVLRSVYLFS